MKKLLLFSAVVLTMVSCLDSGSFSQSYMADITFEFSNDTYATQFKDSLYFMPEGEGFLYGNYPLMFAQSRLDGTFQGGFMMSYLRGEKDGALTRPESENDMYRVHNPSGAAGSRTYAVFYQNPVDEVMPKHDLEFGFKDVGSCTMLGCYVNNTTLVARKVKEHFTDGDKLILRAKGYKHDGSVDQTDIVLAEYTEAKDSIMYNWTAFSLSKLGSIDYVDFEVISTNPEVPGYFCIDGVLASIDISY